MEQIITSLLENDFYKFTQGQLIYHQFNNYQTTWTFKCRNGNVNFTPEMVHEIRHQIKLYCNLKFTKDELNYLKTFKFIHQDYIDFLERWQPRYEDFNIHYDSFNGCGLYIETNGTWLNTSMYEIPVLAIVNEVYFKSRFNDDYNTLKDSFMQRLKNKIFDLNNVTPIGTFSEFGLRRRLSAETQDILIQQLREKINNCENNFVGTSNVYFAKKYDVKPVGTMAHELIMCIGQGNHKHNPAYSNWYAMDAWIKEYGVLNGIVLTDTIGTDCFLNDFQLTFATLFSGVRHDSGNPYVWGDKIINHYKKLGINPKTKTLLFSDSLNINKAYELREYFKDRINTAFGIGTYFSNDTYATPLNIVMKVTECNGQPVAKLSDAEGKGMCKDKEYVDYLKRSIEWRMTHVN